MKKLYAAIFQIFLGILGFKCYTVWPLHLTDQDPTIILILSAVVFLSGAVSLSEIIKKQGE